MTTYISRRCLQAVIILFGLTIIFFIIVNAQPGGACAYILASPKPSAHLEYQQCIVAKGLNKPIPQRYVTWLVGVAHGNFGTDFTGKPVIDTLKLRIPATLILVGVAYIFQQLVAIPLGMLGALKRYSLFDQVLTLFSYVGLSMPTFWLGLMLILLFAVNLSILPPGGIVTPGFPVSFGTGNYWSWLLAHPGTGISDLFAHVALPGLTLAIVGIAVDSRYMRASMLDVISQDFVRTARAKGLPPHKVVLKHTLRNALLPIITQWGLYLPTLVGGAIITETIFGWPGMGKYFIDALNNRDSNAMMSVLLLTALAVLVFNLLADLTYAWVDPRIRYD